MLSRRMSEKRKPQRDLFSSTPPARGWNVAPTDAHQRARRDSSRRRATTYDDVRRTRDDDDDDDDVSIDEPARDDDGGHARR
jgi:hypothetical protein